MSIKIVISFTIAVLFIGGAGLFFYNRSPNNNVERMVQPDKPIAVNRDKPIEADTNEEKEFPLQAPTETPTPIRTTETKEHDIPRGVLDEKGE